MTEFAIPPALVVVVAINITAVGLIQDLMIHGLLAEVLHRVAGSTNDWSW
jgi:hypothetical protein